MNKSKILLVGLAPPPFHGQSIATGLLFDHDWRNIDVEKLPIRYSKNVNEIGKASLGKVFYMFKLVFRCWRMKFKTGSNILYYTPTSPNLVPFVRDVVFLALCRPLFKQTLLHYHAGGMPQFLESNWLLKLIGKWIYGRKSWAVALTSHVKVPDLDYGASKLFTIANGVEVPKEMTSIIRQERDTVEVLFVGNLYEDKGVFDAISAVGEVQIQTSKRIVLNVMGDSPDREITRRIKTLISSLNVKVNLLGVCKGEEKWKRFKTADIFLFPSYYSSENQPLVLLEAMASGLPIVATNWRGIPGQVVHGESGILVEPKKVSQIVDALGSLVDSFDKRVEMGEAGKRAYLKEFTTSAHIKKVESLFLESIKSLNDE